MGLGLMKKRRAAMLLKPPRPSLWRIRNLRQMEGSLTLFDCDSQLLTKHIDCAVIGHFKIVDTSHDTRQIVIGRERRLSRLAHDSEHGCEGFESCERVRNALAG